MSGCQSGSPIRTDAELVRPSEPLLSLNQNQTLQLLYAQYKEWRGTPYRYGGNNRSGIDCSAFVQRTFMSQFAIELPRTTKKQILAGIPIKRTDLQSGDLVFFNKGTHVGIYLQDDRFLHASTKAGVIISSIHNSYWSRHYWRAIRVPFLY